MSPSSRETLLRLIVSSQPPVPYDVESALAGFEDIIGHLTNGDRTNINIIYQWAHNRDDRVDAILRAATLLLLRAGVDAGDIRKARLEWRDANKRPARLPKSIREPGGCKTEPLW